MTRPAITAAAALAALLALAGAAAGAERDPVQRQTLVDLAYVMGQSHALRQACAGPDDQFWRERMFRLIAAEAPDQGLDRTLRDTFNAGFASAQSAFPACTAQSRRAEAKAAARGKALAGALAGE